MKKNEKIGNRTNRRPLFTPVSRRRSSVFEAVPAQRSSSALIPAMADPEDNISIHSGEDGSENGLEVRDSRPDDPIYQDLHDDDVAVTVIESVRRGREWRRLLRG